MHYAALDALFTEKSVTRAGERIHLSQSATNVALSRLGNFSQSNSSRSMFDYPATILASYGTPAPNFSLRNQHDSQIDLSVVFPK